MGVELRELDKDYTLPDVEAQGINIQNIAASFDIEGEFDIEKLSSDLPNSEHDPDKHRSLIYRSPTGSGTILLPRQGRVSLAGATSRRAIITTIEEFIKELSVIDVDRAYSDVRVENVVATVDFDCSLDLVSLTVALGLEQTEYEPEQFPGIIYRPDIGVVILIFGTGKVVITDVQTYKKTICSCEYIRNELSDFTNID